MIRSILPLILAVSASAWAQLRFFESEALSSIAPLPRRPIVADVTSTLTAQTPWGVFTHRENGKYWRSRNGKIRQDNDHGLSMVADLGSRDRSFTIVDYQLRRIDRTEARLRPDQRSGTRANKDSLGDDFNLNDTDEDRFRRTKKAGRAVLEDFKVTIRTGKDSAGRSFEVWTADDIKMIVLYKVTSGSAEMVQRYRNIRLEDPDPALFELPTGFRMVKRFHEISPQTRPKCLRQEFSIVGDPKILDFERLCSGQ